MPIAAICSCEKQTIGRLMWLFEDIWLERDTDAQLHLEGIIEVTSLESIDAIRIYLPFKIADLYNETSECMKHEFVKGYTKCWPGVYTEYRLDNQSSPKLITINGIRAVVSDVTARIVEADNDASEIEIRFDPPAKKGETRIFRIVFRIKNLVNISNWLLRRASKSMILNSYGLAAFGGGNLHSLLQERQIEYNQVFPVDVHHTQISYWGVITNEECSRPVLQDFFLSGCRNPSRYCPPIERQARITGIPTKTLKESSNSYMHWVDYNMGFANGDQIRVVFSESKIQHWLLKNWVALIALIIGTLSLGFNLVRLLSKKQ